MFEFKCEVCSCVFYRKQRNKPRDNAVRSHRFCSHQCRYQAMRGNKQTAFYKKENESTNYYVVNNNKREHVQVVLSARKQKPIPKGAQIHHVDGNKQNNNHNNLVLCPNAAYHRLIEARSARIKDTGSIDKIRCILCKKIKDKDDFYKDTQKWDKKSTRCKMCHCIYKKERYKQIKETHG